LAAALDDILASNEQSGSSSGGGEYHVHVTEERRKIALFSVIGLFVAAGVIMLRLSSAATNAASSEAEAGDLHNVQIVDGDGASGGRAVLFAAAPTGPGFYVDCNNGNDSNDGTSAGTAWKSLSKLSSKTLAAGETAYLARGCTFDGGLRLQGDGTAVANVALDAFGSGNAPVIRNTVDTSQTSYGVALEGDYRTVQNILVKDVRGAGVAVRGSHGTVKNIEVTNSGEGVLIESSGPNAYVYKVYAHDLKLVFNTPGGDDDYGAVGFDVQASDVEIAYSKCVRCRAPSFDYGNDGGFVEIWRTADNLYVHHNWAEETEGFMEAGGDEQSTHANGIRIAYNVLYNTGSAFYIHSDGKFAIPLSGLRFENNTVYQPADTPHLLFHAPDGEVTMRNNVFSVSSEAGDTPAVHTNNIFHMIGGGSIGFAPGPSEKTSDPLFVNAAAKDFHLKAGSPARGLGVGGLGYATDYDGVAVPATPDAGAFQYK
jgi:hypothetical protein